MVLLVALSMLLRLREVIRVSALADVSKAELPFKNSSILMSVLILWPSRIAFTLSTALVGGVITPPAIPLDPGLLVIRWCIVNRVLLVSL